MAVEIESASYQNRGFVTVRGLFSPREAAAIKADAIRILTRDGKLGVASGVNVWMADELGDLMKRTVTEPRLTAVIRTLIGDQPEFLSVKTVFKSADKRFASPWHQDWFYWKGSAKLSAWIALDDATEANGCLRLIPGSHRRVFAMASVKSDTGFEQRIESAELEGLADETVPAAAGDVVFFHDLTVHASHPNRSGEDRWSLIATYRNGSEPDSSTVWSSGLPL